MEEKSFPRDAAPDHVETYFLNRVSGHASSPCVVFPSLHDVLTVTLR